MVEKIGFKMDYEIMIWWLPELLQIKYGIESNPVETQELVRKVASILSSVEEIKEKGFKKIQDSWYKLKMKHVKIKPEENQNWRIRYKQLYFFRWGPIKSTLELDSNPRTLTVAK